MRNSVVQVGSGALILSTMIFFPTYPESKENGKEFAPIAHHHSLTDYG